MDCTVNAIWFPEFHIAGSSSRAFHTTTLYIHTRMQSPLLPRGSAAHSSAFLCTSPVVPRDPNDHPDSAYFRVNISLHSRLPFHIPQWARTMLIKRWSTSLDEHRQDGDHNVGDIILEFLEEKSLGARSISIIEIGICSFPRLGLFSRPCQVCVCDAAFTYAELYFKFRQTKWDVVKYNNLMWKNGICEEDVPAEKKKKKRERH